MKCTEKLWMIWHKEKGLMFSTAAADRMQTIRFVEKQFGEKFSWLMLAHNGYKLVKVEISYEVLESGKTTK